MLSYIKMLIGETANNKDDILNYLIESAKTFTINYCRLKEYNSCLDNSVIRMVIEDFNRLGGEGLPQQGFSGMNETYNNDYSDQVYKSLNKFRKIKTL